MGNDISLRFKVDASQAQSQIDSMSSSIGGLSDKLKEATEAGNWKDAANLTMAISNLETAQKQHIQLSNQSVRNPMQHNIANIANRAAGAVSTFASGNYAGTLINATRGTGGTLQKVGQGVAQKEGLAAMGTVLSAVGIGGIIAAAGMAATNALSAKYEAALPNMSAYNRMFQGQGENSNAQELAWHRKATEAARGTNLETSEMLKLARDNSKYGFSDGQASLNAARTAALLAYSTGADVSSVQGLMGTETRYGGKADIDVAYKGLLASGMKQGQFNEFLNNLQKVMEDGISKGYMRTTEEIAANLTMFARLSDNDPMWQGEQGTNRLMQMNNSIAGAVGLSNVNDVIVASVANNILNDIDNDTDYKRLTGKKRGDWSGTYIDAMLMMEKGVSPELVGGVYDAIDKSEGDNIQGQIERFKNIYGLNYSGAVEVYKMKKKHETGDNTYQEITSRIKEMQTKEDYQSNETKLQNVLNDLNQTMVDFGEGAFDLKIAGFGNIEKITQGIYDILNKDEDKSKFGQRMEEMYNKIAASISANKNAQENKVQASSRSGVQEISKEYANIFDKPNSADINRGEFDKEFMKMFDVYAKHGEKKGIFGRIIHEADGIASKAEEKKAVETALKNEVLQNAYTEGDKSGYIRELRAMLEDLFGDITLTEK